MNKHALVIGIDHYSRDFYGGDISLKFCKYDAQRVLSLLDGFEITEITDSDATESEIKRQIVRLAEVSQSGDTVFIYQSSHGTTSPGAEGDASALCCYDGVLWDFEIYDLLRLFKPGVKTIMAFDTCHSESTHRAAMAGVVAKFAPLPPSAIPPAKPTSRSLRGIAAKRIIHMAACRWNSYSYEIQAGDDVGGVFTTALYKALAAFPNATPNYLYDLTKAHCRGYQEPFFDIKGGRIRTGTKALL